MKGWHQSHQPLQASCPVAAPSETRVSLLIAAVCVNVIALSGVGGNCASADANRLRASTRSFGTPRPRRPDHVNLRRQIYIIASAE